MAGGRRTTPLFDLLSRTQATTPPPAPPKVSKPVVRVELKPREPSYAPPEPVAPEPEPVTTLSRGWTPSNKASVLIAAAILGAVAIWAVAWTLGKGQGKREMEPLVRRDPPAVVEPSASEPNLVIGASTVPPVTQPKSTPKTATPAPKTNATPPPPAPKAQPKAAPAEAPAVTSPKALPPATGMDPREVGRNYLYLANLPTTDAVKAVDFLRQNGVDAHYILVDPGSGSANNQDPGVCRVFVLPGLTSEEYSQSIRTKLETEVVRLGAIWQRDYRGSSNFQKFGWEKLKN